MMVFLAVGCASDPEPVRYPLLALQEVVRVKNPSQAGPSAVFGGGTMDADGSVYLIDQTRSEILVFDSAGKFLRSIGRPGDKHGEFAMLGSIGITGDTLWVADPRLGRLTLFDREGKVRSAVDNSETISALSAARYSLLGLMGDGSRLVAVAPPGFDIDTERNRTIAFLRVSRSGSLDTLFNLPIPGTFTIGSGNSARYIAQPFDDRPTFGVRRDGGAWVEVERSSSGSGAGAVQITRHSLERRDEWTATVAVTPVRIPGNVADSIVKDATANPDVARRLRQWLRMPERMPLVMGVMLTDDGTIWLNEASRSTESRWIRLDARGAPNGVLTMPRTSEIVFAGAEQLWLIERDAGGAASLVRYRVSERG